MRIKTEMQQSNYQLPLCDCVIEKTVFLSNTNFYMFLSNYNKVQDFLTSNSDLMYIDDDNAYHCILVRNESTNEGVVVFSETGIAEHTAYIEDMKIVDLQNLPKPLTQFVDTMLQVQKGIVQKVLDDNDQGSLNLSRDYIEENLAEGYPVNMYMLKEMLLECDEIESVSLDSDNLYITTGEDFANYPYSRLDESDYAQLEIMAAKHTLWNYDEGGEQFILEDIHAENMSFVGKCLNGAIIRNCSFKNCDFSDAEFCSADLSGTVFDNCKLNNVVAEESNCADTLFDGCEMVKSVFTHSNFKDACFHMCYAERLHLTSCCLEGTDLETTDESGFDLSNAYQTLEEYEASNNPNITMGDD